MAGRPLKDFSYSRITFFIAAADKAILEIRYFKLGAEEPYRRMTASRDAMERAHGFVIPTEMTVENIKRGTKTDVTLRDLEIGAESFAVELPELLGALGPPHPGAHQRAQIFGADPGVGQQIVDHGRNAPERRHPLVANPPGETLRIDSVDSAGS